MADFAYELIAANLPETTRHEAAEVVVECREREAEERARAEQLERWIIWSLDAAKGLIAQMEYGVSRRWENHLFVRRVDAAREALEAAESDYARLLTSANRPQTPAKTGLGERRS